MCMFPLGRIACADPEGGTGGPDPPPEKSQRSTYSYAHAWIFFNVCILITHHYTNYENVCIELDS